MRLLVDVSVKLVVTSPGPTYTTKAGRSRAKATSSPPPSHTTATSAERPWKLAKPPPIDELPYQASQRPWTGMAAFDSVTG